MNAIDFLNEQHDEVEALFEKAQKAKGSEKKMELFTQIADALAIHATIEERIFYPAVRARRTEDILLEALEEHLAIKRLLADLLDLEPENETFDAKIKVLSEEVEHHVGDEKKELFPKVKKIFGAEELEMLGAELEAMTEELEGTDPRLQVRGETEEAAPLP